MRAAGELVKAGVKFAFATGDSDNVRQLPYDAAQSVAWGLTHDDAIRALTMNAAEILGVSRSDRQHRARQDREPVHREGRPARSADGR